jgi:drug/metabolite transporter (DMT)-like permease
MYLAHLASVNVGIITTIWGVQPLGAAVLDYLINKEKLTIYHLLGMILIVGGGIAVSLSDKENLVQT